MAAEHAALARCASQIERSRRNEQEKLRLLDLWRFQRDEIESAGMKSGQDTELELERRHVAELTKLQENAAAAFEILYESQTAPSVCYGRR